MFYTPVTSEYFRLGIHGSIRREKSLPYLAGGTVGVGLGTEINPINLIVDERNPIYLTVGTKGQFYFTLPGEVDKDNDGTIDGPAEIGTIGLFQVYCAKKLYKGIELIGAYSFKHINFKSDIKNLKTKFPINENKLEVGLRISTNLKIKK